MRMMKYLISLMIGAFTVGAVANAAPKTTYNSHTEGRATVSRQVSINTKRMIPIVGPIGGDTVLRGAAKLQQLLKEGTAPVYLYLNSPGGSVQAGYYFINAMEKAQGLGVKFICVVDDMAASMAFQFLAHCDTRYSMKSSMLLWHPVRVGLFMATLTPAQAQTLANDLSYIESVMVPKLKSVLRISDADFTRHYNEETLHYGIELYKLSPSFLTIVDTISNLVEVRELAVKSAVPDAPPPADNRLTDSTRPYDITYIYEGI